VEAVMARVAQTLAIPRHSVGVESEDGANDAAVPGEQVVEMHAVVPNPLDEQQGEGDSLVTTQNAADVDADATPGSELTVAVHAPAALAGVGPSSRDGPPPGARINAVAGFPPIPHYTQHSLQRRAAQSGAGRSVVDTIMFEDDDDSEGDEAHSTARVYQYLSSIVLLPFAAGLFCKFVLGGLLCLGSHLQVDYSIISIHFAVTAFMFSLITSMYMYFVLMVGWNRECVRQHRARATSRAQAEGPVRVTPLDLNVYPQTLEHYKEMTYLALIGSLSLVTCGYILKLLLYVYLEQITWSWAPNYTGALFTVIFLYMFVLALAALRRQIWDYVVRNKLVTEEIASLK